MWFPDAEADVATEPQVSLLWTHLIVLAKYDTPHKNCALFRNRITNKITGYPQTLAFTIVAANVTDSEQKDR